MVKKKRVTTTISGVKYVGRFLGFLLKEEFLKVAGNPNISSRIESKETRGLVDCSSALIKDERHNALIKDGFRFVIALTARDGKPTYKRLLVSELLDYISQVSTGNTYNEVSFMTKERGVISVKEVEQGDTQI